MRVRCYLVMGTLLLVPARLSSQARPDRVPVCVARPVDPAPPRPAMERHLIPLTAPDATPDATPSISRPSASEATWCGRGWELRPLRPSGRATFHDGIPDGRADGAAMTSNGLSLHARGGVEGTVGPFAFRFAPEITIEENVGFETFPGADPSRSPLASPFYIGRLSADLPSRFGLTARSTVHLGESGLWWDSDRLALSLATGIPRWGPLGGEGLVIGTTASGVPRAELAVRLRHHQQSLTLRSFAGIVTESPFFDATRTNDWRPLAGVRAEWRPADPRLRVGAARTVMDGRRHRALLDGVTLAWRRAPADSLIDMTSLDGEWIDREAGSWGWVELLRQVPISSVRDLLRHPTEGLALRIGGSQRIALDRSGAWYASAEYVRLDQPQQRTDRLEQDLYTSPTVVQGWTHRGQPLGSGLGPGGQRQLIGVDRRGTRFRIGGFVERARWNDGMLYRQFLTGSLRHDVSVLGGLHLSRVDDPDALTIRAAVGRRFNYLFQNDEFNPGYRTADLPLLVLSVLFTP